MPFSKCRREMAAAMVIADPIWSVPHGITDVTFLCNIVARRENRCTTSRRVPRRARGSAFVEPPCGYRSTSEGCEAF